MSAVPMNADYGTNIEDELTGDEKTSRPVSKASSGRASNRSARSRVGARGDEHLTDTAAAARPIFLTEDKKVGLELTAKSLTKMPDSSSLLSNSNGELSCFVLSTHNLLDLRLTPPRINRIFIFSLLLSKTFFCWERLEPTAQVWKISKLVNVYF